MNGKVTNFGKGQGVKTEPSRLNVATYEHVKRILQTPFYSF